MTVFFICIYIYICVFVCVSVCVKPLSCRCSFSSVWLYVWAQLSVMLIRTSDRLITPLRSTQELLTPLHTQLNHWERKKLQFNCEMGDKARKEEISMTELWGWEWKHDEPNEICRENRTI